MIGVPVNHWVGVDDVGADVAERAGTRFGPVQPPGHRRVLVAEPVLQVLGPDVPDRADPPLVDELLGQGQGRRSAVGESAHRVDALADRLAGRGRHLLGLGDRVGQRLLAQHVLAGPQGGDGDLAVGVPGVQMSIRSMSSRSMTRRQSVSTDATAEPLRGRPHRSLVAAGHDGQLRGQRQVEESVGVPPRLRVHGAHERVADHAHPQRARRLSSADFGHRAGPLEFGRIGLTPAG